MDTTSLEKFFAGINLTVGALATLLGVAFFAMLLGMESNSRSMAAVVLFVWALLGLLTLPCLIHGVLYFKFPLQFHKYGHFVTLFILFEIAGIYVKTKGFYDLFYSNHPYQLKEFLVFAFIFSYFASHLFVFKGKLYLFVRNLLTHG